MVVKSFLKDLENRRVLIVLIKMFRPLKNPSREGCPLKEFRLFLNLQLP
jgi:hypothetical protein